jgi:hypothetical protein
MAGLGQDTGCRNNSRTSLEKDRVDARAAME